MRLITKEFIQKVLKFQQLIDIKDSLNYFLNLKSFFMQEYQEQQKDSIIKAFLLFQQFIVCQICEKQIPIYQDIPNTILQHLRQYQHQEKLHALFNPAEFIQESEPLFDISYARSLNRKDDQDLLKYFELLLIDLFEKKDIKHHTKMTYISLLKNYYLTLYQSGRNTLIKQELETVIQTQKNKQNKSIFKQFLQLIIWKKEDKLTSKQNKLKNDFEQIEKKKEINWFKEQLLVQFISILKTIGYTRLSLFLYLLFETNLISEEILFVSSNHLKQGSHLVEGIINQQKVEKELKISLDQQQKIEMILEQEQNVLLAKHLLYPKKSIRDLQRELQMCKKKALNSVNDENQNLVQFIKKLKLKHINLNKKSLKQSQENFEDVKSSIYQSKDQISQIYQNHEKEENFEHNLNIDENNKSQIQLQNQNQTSTQQFLGPIQGMKKILNRVFPKQSSIQQSNLDIVSISSNNSISKLNENIDLGENIQASINKNLQQPQHQNKEVIEFSEYQNEKNNQEAN